MKSDDKHRHDMVVRSCAQALSVLDPDGTRLGEGADTAELGRQAARLVVGSSEVWEEHLGPMYDTEGVRRLLARDGKAVSRQAVSKRHSLLALKTGSGRVVYPAFQFRGRLIVNGMREVLDVFPPTIVSRWTVASWLVSPAVALDGGR